MDGILDDLADTAWDTASEEELLNAARNIETWSRRLYGTALAVTAELDTRGVARARGITSTAVLLREALRITPGQARHRVADARALRPQVHLTGEVVEPVLPLAAAGVEAGVLSAEHLRIIRRTVGDLPEEIPPQMRAEVESRLVGEAEQFDPVILDKVAHRIRAHLDPDGTLTDERRAVARRELSFIPDLDGTVLLRGRLDAEAAAIVRAALDPLATPRPADPDGMKDPRSPARRRADALVQACRMLLDAGSLPTHSGGQRPHLNITIRLIDLITGLGAADLDGTTGPGISAAAARRAACDAQIIPIVLGANSEPLDVGRASYTVPAPMRRALIARDRGCAFPGCDRPPSWCAAHHVIHWADGGPTALWNIVLLCDHHHGVVHDQDWQIRIVNGHPEFIPPTWLDPTQTPRRNTLHNPPTQTAA